MIRLGNYLFHYRNFLFSFFYLMLYIVSQKLFPGFIFPLIAGFIIPLSRQVIRIITIGLQCIIRRGKNRKIYAEELFTTNIFSHRRNPLYVRNILIIEVLALCRTHWYLSV